MIHSFYFKWSATSVQRYVKRKSPLFFSSLCLPLVCQLFHKPVLFSEMEFEFLLLVFILGDWPSRPPWLLLLWKINTFINQLNHHGKNSDITYRNFDLVFSNCNPWSLVRRYRHHSLHSHWHYVQQRNDHRNRSLQIKKWRLKQNFRF